MNQDLLILSLIVLNIIQGAYIIWSAHTYVNKVMSKNFYEYKQAKEYKVPKREPKLHEVTDHSELSII